MKPQPEEPFFFLSLPNYLKSSSHQSTAERKAGLVPSSGMLPLSISKRGLLCVLPGATTKYQRWCLRQHTFLFSQFKIKVSTEFVAFRVVRERSASSLWCVADSSGYLHLVLSLYAVSQGHQSYWLRAHSNDLTLIQLSL
jgi:hypothetical protein